MEDLGCGCAFVVLAVLVFGFTAEMFGHAIGLQVVGYTIAAILLLFGIVGLKDAFRDVIKK